MSALLISLLIWSFYIRRLLYSQLFAVYLLRLLSCRMMYQCDLSAKGRNMQFPISVIVNVMMINKLTHKETICITNNMVMWFSATSLLYVQLYDSLKMFACISNVHQNGFRSCNTKKITNTAHDKPFHLRIDESVIITIMYVFAVNVSMKAANMWFLTSMLLNCVCSLLSEEMHHMLIMHYSLRWPAAEFKLFDNATDLLKSVWITAILPYCTGYQLCGV